MRQPHESRANSARNVAVASLAHYQPARKFVANTIARRHVAPVTLIQPQSGAVLPVIIMQQETPQFNIQLRGNNSSEAMQLLWINKQPLTVPSAAIYMASSDKISLSGAHYLGKIESRGTYVFNLPQQKQKEQINFIVYDFIHRQIIKKVNFSLK